MGEDEANAAHHAGDHGGTGELGDLRHAAAQAEDDHQHRREKDGADVVAQILFHAGHGDGLRLTGNGRDRAGEEVAERADQIGKARGLEREAARLRVEQLRHAVDDNGDDRQNEGADVLPEVQGDHLIV